MKKLITILFFVLVIHSSWSQNEKDIIYLDNNNAQLTKKEFQSLNSKDVYIFEEWNNGIQYRKVVYKKNYAKLDSIKLNQIKALLSKIIGSDYLPTKNTMIHLYSEKDEFLIASIKNRKYWNWIRKNDKKFQAFLIGTKDSGIKKQSKNHVFSDNYDILKNLFFSDFDFKINHLFLKPNGEVLIYYGDNDILKILDWSV